MGSLLDDKRLLADYNKVIDYGQIGAKPIKENEASFARKFILFLLRSRFLFDQFIIKREYAGDASGASKSCALRAQGIRRRLTMQTQDFAMRMSGRRPMHHAIRSV